MAFRQKNLTNFELLVGEIFYVVNQQLFQLDRLQFPQ